MREYSILIVDDEFPARKRICRMIEQLSGFSVVGEGRNGQDGLRLFEELKPDIVLADIEMPVMNGLEMIQKIREQNPSQIVVILSCYESFSYAQQAIRCHVQDYLIKDMTQAQQLEEVLQQNIASLEDPDKTIRDLRTRQIPPEQIQGIHTQTLEEIETRLGQLALGFLSHNYGVCQSILTNFSQINIQGFSKYCFMQYILDMMITWITRECVQYQVSAGTVFAGWGSPLDLINQEQSPDTAMQTLLTWIRRLFDASSPVGFSPRISNIILYISEHYTEDLTLQTIADAFHISPVHLSRSFKAETGKNIITYINIIRIEKAKLLLASGHYQISEIAYLVGFHNIQNFHNTFKKIEGTAPSEFSSRLFQR